MGMGRSLTTSYHPQADGQTEILNQSLEVALRTYVGPQKDDWSGLLDGLALSYNTSPHTATGFSPAYLLRGYHPITSSTIVHSPSSITRPVSQGSNSGGEISSSALDLQASDLVSHFEADRSRAKEALLLGQVFQKRAYNQGRLAYEFEEGDLVLINPHSLKLYRTEEGKGQKLLMKYEGPFEIIQKISPVTYRLRMPASFGIHPVINIAHLERYNLSPMELGTRPTKPLSREDFQDLPEYEVEKILAEKLRKRGNKRIRLFRTRFTGYGPEADEWLTAKQLKNAPEVLKTWQERPSSSRDRS